MSPAEYGIRGAPRRRPRSRSQALRSFSGVFRASRDALRGPADLPRRRPSTTPLVEPPRPAAFDRVPYGLVFFTRRAGDAREPLAHARHADCTVACIEFLPGEFATPASLGRRTGMRVSAPKALRVLFEFEFSSSLSSLRVLRRVRRYGVLVPGPRSRGEILAAWDRQKRVLRWGRRNSGGCCSAPRGRAGARGTVGRS